MVSGRPITNDRDAALEAAIELLWEEGFASSSMENLLDRMGLSRSSFYSAFGSKHALLLRALERYAERAIVKLRGVADGEGSRQERLRMVVQTIAQVDEPRGCLLVNCMAELAGKDPEAREILLAYDREVNAILGALLTDPSRAPLVKSAAYGATLLKKIGTSSDVIRSMLEGVLD